MLLAEYAGCPAPVWIFMVPRQRRWFLPSSHAPLVLPRGAQVARDDWDRGLGPDDLSFSYAKIHRSGPSVEVTLAGTPAQLKLKAGGGQNPNQQINLAAESARLDFLGEWSVTARPVKVVTGHSPGVKYNGLWKPRRNLSLRSLVGFESLPHSASVWISFRASGFLSQFKHMQSG